MHDDPLEPDQPTPESGPQAADPTKLNELAEVCEDPNVTFTERAAAGRELVKINSPIIEAGPMPEEQLRYQASVFGTELRRFAALARIDQRAPDQVLSSGFQPNPRNDTGSLFDHIEKKGSSNLVSTSQAVGNENVLTMLSINDMLNPLDTFSNTFQVGEVNITASNEVYRQYTEEVASRSKEILAQVEGLEGDERKQRIEELEDQHNVELAKKYGGLVAKVSTGYEYLVADTDGVKIPTDLKDYPFLLEDEVIVSQIAPGSIVAVREVMVLEIRGGIYAECVEAISHGCNVLFGVWAAADGKVAEAEAALGSMGELLAKREAAGFSWALTKQMPFSEAQARLAKALRDCSK